MRLLLELEWECYKRISTFSTALLALSAIQPYFVQTFT